jgi:di/tricarboxylate transporter
MLPVATPPNAIIMDSPAVTRGAILRARTRLDLLGTSMVVALGRIHLPLVA